MLTSQQICSLLKSRFDSNLQVSSKLNWEDFEAKLHQDTIKIDIIRNMEQTGGEPQLLFYNPSSHEFHVYDCSKESPINRRSLCYDQQALTERKEHKPIGSCVECAKKLGIELLTEEEYKFLQQFGPFDTKTSSWLATPKKIRDFGGAIFGDFRYGTTFIYHNGASSYYAARGFRGKVIV